MPSFCLRMDLEGFGGLPFGWRLCCCCFGLGAGFKPKVQPWGCHWVSEGLTVSCPPKAPLPLGTRAASPDQGQEGPEVTQDCTSHGHTAATKALNRPVSSPQPFQGGRRAQVGQIQQKIQSCLPPSPPPVLIPNQPARISLEVKKMLPVIQGDNPSPSV